MFNSHTTPEWTIINNSNTQWIQNSDMIVSVASKGRKKFNAFTGKKSRKFNSIAEAKTWCEANQMMP